MEIAMEVKPKSGNLSAGSLGIIIVILIVIVLCVYLLYINKEKLPRTLRTNKHSAKLTIHAKVPINKPNHSVSTENKQGGNQSATFNPPFQSSGNTPSVPFTGDSTYNPNTVETNTETGVGVINNTTANASAKHVTLKDNHLPPAPNPIDLMNSNPPVVSSTPNHTNEADNIRANNNSIPPTPPSSHSRNSDIDSNGFASSQLSSTTSPSTQIPPIHPSVSNHSKSSIPVDTPTNDSSVDVGSATTANASHHQQQEQEQQQHTITNNAAMANQSFISSQPPLPNSTHPRLSPPPNSTYPRLPPPPNSTHPRLPPSPSTITSTSSTRNS